MEARGDGVDGDAGPSRAVPQGAPITVFIASWGRPLYLWACLDALYRLTRTPARFVLLDNAHPDPLVGEVILGFARRGMFDEVVRFRTNALANIATAYEARLAGIGPLNVYIEADCVVVPESGCWLGAMREIMDRNPAIGMLGSVVDPSDFVPRERALRLTDGDVDRAEYLAKLNSVERAFLADPRWVEAAQDLVLTEPPFPVGNPPGRLMMLRTRVMQEVGFQVDDRLALAMKARGLQAAVTARVRHRHLSLLNVYDHPGMDRAARNRFFSGESPGAPPGPRRSTGARRSARGSR
ncbi:MAG: hypothetical protein ACKOTZ_01520 [Chloroflexota bacterium]